MVFDGTQKKNSFNLLHFRYDNVCSFINDGKSSLASFLLLKESKPSVNPVPMTDITFIESTAERSCNLRPVTESGQIF